jgi:hypothetical protein
MASSLDPIALSAFLPPVAVKIAELTRAYIDK